MVVENQVDRGTVFLVVFSVIMGSFGIGNAAPLIGIISVASASTKSILSIIMRVRLRYN